MKVTTENERQFKEIFDATISNFVKQSAEVKLDNNAVDGLIIDVELHNNKLLCQVLISDKYNTDKMFSAIIKVPSLSAAFIVYLMDAIIINQNA